MVVHSAPSDMSGLGTDAIPASHVASVPTPPSTSVFGNDTVVTTVGWSEVRLSSLNIPV